MPDFGRGPGGPESLDDINRSDRLLDALAGGQQRIRPGDAGEAELLALLEGWRDGVRTPGTNVLSEQDAVSALHRGLSQRPTQTSGTRRHLAVVGSVAAAMLCIGGFGAVVAGSGPGDSLYGMRTALFGEPQSVRDDRVALAAQTEMAEVQRLIDQGDWQQAQVKLQTLTTSVVQVEDAGRQQELVDQWNQLNVKVESQDPAATLPPPEPGDPPLTLPQVTILVTPPSDTPQPSDATSPVETTPPSDTTSPVETTPPSETPVSTPEPTPTPSTTPEPSPTPGTTSPTTTTTSVPSTTPPTTTTTTLSSSSTTTTTTTSAAAEAEESVSTETSAPAPSTTLVEVEPEPTPTAEVTSVQEQAPVTATPTTTTVPNGPLIQLPIPGFN
ncbi:hypothetical protein BVC93_03335 [Mycobacterium sp. MS1601]|uniref:anti-sigma-D factor RsdA n=1 Tax=Mycobacterium sp. MS1601 TaxID=1936029 RepID=UPI0009794ADB|nr:anti-sigma-D factor RsdA [Mycobacterium sp. MS1601]AQA01623.1 hypothetical protein BVC93_03335 [Mycobacterium sp. MS1601]